MPNNFKIIEYNNEVPYVEKGDFIKITIFFNECYDSINSLVVYDAKEHIWTHVTSIDDKKITVSISNHMYFKPIDNPNCLEKDNLLVINKSNTKELKRYTPETHQNTINSLLSIIEELPLEQQLSLKYLEPTVREEYFEQLLNTRIIE